MEQVSWSQACLSYTSFWTPPKKIASVCMSVCDSDSEETAPTFSDFWHEGRGI